MENLGRKRALLFDGRRGRWSGRIPSPVVGGSRLIVGPSLADVTGMGRNRSEGARESADRPWVGRAALTFVLLTLVTLVVVPLLVDRRVGELRVEMEAAEPTRTILSRLQYSMMREMATLTEMLLTGDREYAAVYTLARESEVELLEALEPLAELLGPPVDRRLVEVRRLADRWHEEVDDRGILSGDASVTDFPRARELFEQVLEAITIMDAAVVQESDRLRAEIRETELTGLRLTALLGLLALGSAGAVAMLHWRARQFGEEAERRRYEAESALEASARAEASRILLLRGFTHDVKNPLGAAKGYAELLRTGVKGPLREEQTPLVDGIQNSLDSALEIIADLLEAARAESGGISVTPTEVDLNEVAGEAVREHSAAAEAAGHTVVFRAAKVPAVTSTDPARVKQVLGNLFSNAIKYTPSPGRITVTTEVSNGRSHGDGDGIAVKVSDTGPGIPPDRHEFIFDEFTRLSENSGAEGHGLGLAIARRIARILGGDLMLEENEGPGSTFVLWLPRRVTRRGKRVPRATRGGQEST